MARWLFTVQKVKKKDEWFTDNGWKVPILIACIVRRDKLNTFVHVHVHVILDLLIHVPLGASINPSQHTLTVE